MISIFAIIVLFFSNALSRGGKKVLDSLIKSFTFSVSQYHQDLTPVRTNEQEATIKYVRTIVQRCLDTAQQEDSNECLKQLFDSDYFWN